MISDGYLVDLYATGGHHTSEREFEPITLSRTPPKTFDTEPPAKKEPQEWIVPGQDMRF